MAEFRYGPVELFLLGLEGDRPDPRLVAELAELVDDGILRVLDFVIISKSESGDVTVVEIEDDDDDYAALDLVLSGITGEEDIAELAELVPEGGSAAVVALELVYARRLASSLAASGGVVLSSERIPAPVVNALVDAVEEEVAEELVEEYEEIAESEGENR
ncbi:DUF6325 family protein [Microbacterium sp. 4R-513]|uniref:DUF6325 family protein n=1 Tax=Microbacterium sp. 4R-513 TaxID=2567934 RepID=UPI0019D0BE75|nr:DUF6325 family protein [Microbacterium sp. 4R-513]